MNRNLVVAYVNKQHYSCPLKCFVLQLGWTLSEINSVRTFLRCTLCWWNLPSSLPCVPQSPADGIHSSWQFTTTKFKSPSVGWRTSELDCCGSYQYEQFLPNESRIVLKWVIITNHTYNLYVFCIMFLLKIFFTQSSSLVLSGMSHMVNLHVILILFSISKRIITRRQTQIC